VGSVHWRVSFLDPSCQSLWRVPLKNELSNVLAAIEPQPLSQYVFAEKYA
jgi:hypothetical protein